MSHHTWASRAHATTRLTDLAEALVGALMPTDDEPHSWLVGVGQPTGARADDLAGSVAGRRPGARLVSAGGSAPPIEGDIHLLPLDSITDSPHDALMGMVAPDDWWALGLVATGRARRVDRPGQPTSDVLVVLLLDRTGRSAGLVPRLDGTDMYETAAIDAGPEGVLLDLCRRAFGLPTAPPDQPPMAWWAQLWLDAVLRDAAVEPGRTWTWPTLMTRHPLADLLHPPDGAGRPGPDQFARSIEVVVAGYDWERLRRSNLAGPGRDIAAWMDEGCFARWTLGLNPEVSDLLAALQSLLAPEAIGSVTAVLDRWGVLG